MMKTGIIVAMRKELDLLTPLLDNKKTLTADKQVFHTGMMGKHDVVAMQCGIGKVNATIGALTLIRHFHPDLIINTGVAGGANVNVRVMDLVVGTQVAYHDVWCGPESVWGAVQGMPLYYQGDQHLIDLLPARPDIKIGLIASGDQFIDNTEKMNEIKSRFPQVLAVDMESGAIAQTCELTHTPFLSMRVISDSPEASHNNTQQYNNFWEDAPKHSFALLQQLITSL